MLSCSAVVSGKPSRLCTVTIADPVPRDNIDPTGSRTDAEINDALSLIHDNSNASSASSRNDKFRLDSIVLNEGGNFSAGERQLRMSPMTFVILHLLAVVALVRALARGCKVLLLDEATSSVDPETDAIIQRIIQTKFSDVTVGFLPSLSNQD